MNALEAALKVLQEAGKPVHYRDITKRILSAGLWQTDGKTPEATINAQLSVVVKKQGTASAFRRAGRGMFAVNTERTDPSPRVPDMLRSEEPVLYGVRGPVAHWRRTSSTVGHTTELLSNSRKRS